MTRLIINLVVDKIIIVDKVCVFKQSYWATKGIKAVGWFADTDYVYSMNIVGDSYVNYKPFIQHS